MATSSEERNAELMQALDDAWNAQDVDVLRARHKPDMIVRCPGQPEPNLGIEDHTTESTAFWKTFPDQKLVDADAAAGGWEAGGLVGADARLGHRANSGSGLEEAAGRGGVDREYSRARLRMDLDRVPLWRDDHIGSGLRPRTVKAVGAAHHDVTV